MTQSDKLKVLDSNILRILEVDHGLKRYILGYYSASASDMDIMNKESNQTILKELRNAYPKGLNAQELAERTSLPEKTIYAQLNELYKAYFISIQEKNQKSVEDLHQELGRSAWRSGQSENE